MSSLAATSRVIASAMAVTVLAGTDDAAVCLPAAGCGTGQFALHHQVQRLGIHRRTPCPVSSMTHERGGCDLEDGAGAPESSQRTAAGGGCVVSGTRSARQCRARRSPVGCRWRTAWRRERAFVQDAGCRCSALQACGNNDHLRGGRFQVRSGRQTLRSELLTLSGTAGSVPAFPRPRPLAPSPVPKPAGLPGRPAQARCDGA